MSDPETIRMVMIIVVLCLLVMGISASITWLDLNTPHDGDERDIEVRH